MLDYTAFGAHGGWEERMGRKPFDLEDYFSMSQFFGLHSLQISLVAGEAGPLLREFEQSDPLRLAATFGGLLTFPELQSNCIRIEALIHLAIARGRGHKKPDKNLVFRAFSAFDQGSVGRLEDPAEDVFVTSISTARGNYMILEGVWECAGFYLQRFIDLVDGLPDSESVGQLKEAVHALMALSDLVCKRARLTRYSLGNSVPESSLPCKVANSLSSAQRIVRFTEGELRSAGISLDAISGFLFDPHSCSRLDHEAIGHSTLERFPIASRGGEYFFVLPTAASVAIRRMVIEWFEERGLREVMLTGLALEYGKLFSSMPLLGGRMGPSDLEFRRTERNLISGVLKFIDVGRCINLVFVVDTLENFKETGFAGTNPDPTKIAEDVGEWIDWAYEGAIKNPDFLEGVSIIIGCGVGRGARHHLTEKQRENWRVEFIGAADFSTLSWVHKFKSLSLWRILDARDRLLSCGVELQNINGLLNLVAWSRSLDGHLVPHGEVPDDFVREGSSSLLMIDQTSLRNLRHEVAVDCDPHAEQDWSGRWVRVRKEGRSLFEEDREQPLYAPEALLDEGWLPGVFVTNLRPWWCKINVPDATSGHLAYERWKMVTVWLARAAPVLENSLTYLPAGPILYIVAFSAALGVIEDTGEGIEFSDVWAGIQVSRDGPNIIRIMVPEVFERAIFNPENIAERALVCALVTGGALLADKALLDSEHAALVGQIVPDGLARQTHAFRARWFRDFVANSLPSPILIDSDDNAAVKLGLAWRKGARSGGYEIVGKDECISFLNNVVSSLEDELCAELNGFNRRATIYKALTNHEAAIVDRERWSRTAAAVLSLHQDKKAALSVIAEHDFELNAVFLGTRLLVEFALCEASSEGGLNPGQMELSRWMAKAGQLFNLGGMSDAIRWDVMEPRLKITALGDIHANFSFLDQIIQPFARETSDIRTLEAVESYAENLADYKVTKNISDVFDPEFLAAWEDEVGASIEDVRTFVDFVEDIGVRRGSAILDLPRSTFLEVKIEDRAISREKASAIVEFLTLKGGARWRDVPDGYDERDRQPWRFRRRLAVLRKPLLQVGNGDDPNLLVAPGLLRDSFRYTVGGFYRGDFPVWQLKRAMSVWAGRVRDKQGNEFTEEVAERMRELGWSVEPEVKITKLLRKRFDKNFGDVDVLAWNANDRRLLVIECKDVQYKKTLGEIAEQLSDFSGEVGRNGKPDYLLKHLNRVNVISSHLNELSSYVGWKVSSVESHLVFKNPVPIRHALAQMAERVRVTIFGDLNQI